MLLLVVGEAEGIVFVCGEIVVTTTRALVASVLT